MEEFITAGQAARKLGIPRFTLDYRIESGVFPEPRRIGNRRVWTMEEIEHLRCLLADYEARRKSKNRGDIRNGQRSPSGEASILKGNCDE